MDYAKGTVHELTQGATEFNAILTEASSRNQLVVLDFSASWCGPCRMLAPVLAGYAREFQPRLVVVKMDCEATPENAALAREAGISAFPTLHIYRQRERVAVMQGANPPALRAKIIEELGHCGVMTNAVAAQLAKLRAVSTQEEFIAAAKTLVTFISNVLNNPTDAKYRRVKLSNAAFQNKLGSKPGGKESMISLGFVEKEEEGEAMLVMETIDPELSAVKAKLEEAIAMSTGGGSSNALPSTTAATAPGSSGANVNPAALAQALAQAMQVAASSSGGGPATGGATRTTTRHQGRRPLPPGAPPGARQVVVTPKKLARYLEKILRNVGILGNQPSPA